MAQIYLVRHTRVDIPSGICYGATDVPLAETFNSEALLIQGKLQQLVFDAVYSSPLSRCSRLASYLTSNKYDTDNRLHELNFGEWEGKKWEDIYETPYGKEWMNNYLELPCPAGESYKDLFERIEEFIETHTFLGSTLIITHSGVMRAFINILMGTSADELFRKDIQFGEIVKLEVS